MDRHFDPVTLRLFIAVCEERNIARAAAREALVASAVSKRIGAIEQQVGTPLLVRGRVDRAGEVIHVIAASLESLDDRLLDLRTVSRDFH